MSIDYEHNDVEPRHSPGLLANRRIVIGTLVAFGIAATGIGLYLWAFLSHASAHQQWAVACPANLVALGRSIAAYRAMNNDRYPPDLSFLLQRPYSSSATTLCCPSVGPVAAASPPLGPPSSYYYIGAALSARPAPDAIVAFESPRNHPWGANVLYADGVVGCLPAVEFRRSLEKLYETRMEHSLQVGGGTVSTPDLANRSLEELIEMVTAPEQGNKSQ